MSVLYLFESHTNVCEFKTSTIKYFYNLNTLQVRWLESKFIYSSADNHTNSRQRAVSSEFITPSKCEIHFSASFESQLEALRRVQSHLKRKREPEYLGEMSKKPVLYYAPHSPPCRAAQLAAAAVGVDVEFRVVNTRAGEHLTPEFLKMNPQHTIPVLEDNGIVVTDSNVIATYLADKYGKDDSLYPKDVEARNKVLARLFYNCGNLFARLRSIAEPIFYAGASAIGAEKLEYLQKAYDGLDHCLVGNKYVCGDTMTVADLCLVATVSTAHDLAPVDETKFPNILPWIERMSQLPYYEEANRKGADMMLKLITAKLEENKKAAA